MAYLSKEVVKGIRENFKKEFPSKEGWKFSIKNEHHSTVRVVIISAPIDFLKFAEAGMDYVSVNEYYVKEHYPGVPGEKLQKMVDLMYTEDYFDHSDSMTDYFHCSHYISLSIGAWDKKFTHVEA